MGCCVSEPTAAEELAQAQLQLAIEKQISAKSILPGYSPQSIAKSHQQINEILHQKPAVPLF